MIKNSPNQIQENIKTYCIGHSLGAQVCGFFGKNFQKNEILPNSDDEPTFIPARDKNLFLLECFQNRSLIMIHYSFWVWIHSLLPDYFHVIHLG